MPEQASKNPDARLRGENIVVGLLFLVPVVLFAWPAVPQFRSMVLALNDDVVLNLWTFWHATNAFLLRDEPLYSTMRILAPVGSSLALHDMSILPTALLAPVTAALGYVAGYNLLLIMGQLWAGLGVFILVRYLSGSRLSAAFAAFLVESSPILFFRLINHYSLTYIGFIPVFIYLVMRAADPGDRMPARRLGYLTGFVAIACFLTAFNIFILSFFTSGVVWASLIVAAIVKRSNDSLRRLVQVAGWTAMVCTVFFYLWGVVTPVQDARFWWVHERSWPIGQEHYAHLAYYILPNPKFWLFSRNFPELIAATPDLNPECMNFLGAVNLALFVIGMIALFRAKRAIAITMLVAALICFNLSLGFGSVNPLVPGQAAHANPLLLFPKFIELPFLNQARVPGRWAFPLLILVVTVAGCGMHEITSRVRRPWQKLVILGSLSAVAFLETAHIPTPINSFEPPKAYQAIGTAQSPADTIIEWPIFLFCGLKGPLYQKIDTERMIWSMQHKYRIVSGYLSRIPSERVAAILNQPLLRDLWMLQDGDVRWLTDSAPTDEATIKRWIALNSVRYIIFNKRAAPEAALAFIQRLNIARIVFEDDQYTVLKIG